MDNRKSFPPNIVRVCIDCYENDIQGRIYTKLSAEALQFDNCCELLLKTDDLFDRCGYPQTFQEKRDFNGKYKSSYYTAPKICLSDEELDRQSGILGTVDVLVMSRRNTGWQGLIKTEDGNPTVEFKSEIELLGNLRKLFSTGQK